MKLPPPPEQDDDALDGALHRAGQLVASAHGFALALDQIGIELPPAHAAQIDQAQLRAVASLYLASELENAGLLAAVETLAGLAHSGALNVDLGAATPLLFAFWKARGQRASQDERAHSFALLFGPEAGFDEAMLGLCEALYKLDENASNPSYGGISQQMRVRGAASTLLNALLATAGGVTVFIAQDILQSLREALAILKHRAVLAAFGARDVWSVIEHVERIAHSAHVDARNYVQRGRAGMTVLSWLADAAPHLDQQATVLVQLDHPVIGAAIDWMQAALAIGEAAASAPAGAPTPAPVPVPSNIAGTGMPATSPWSALAA